MTKEEREQRYARAAEAVEEAKRKKREGAGRDEVKEAMREALYQVGSLLEDAHDGESEEACEKSCNEMRARFGLEEMVDMPWDGVTDMIGWEEWMGS